MVTMLNSHNPHINNYENYGLNNVVTFNFMCFYSATKSAFSGILQLRISC
jgi:hypothetical protein